MKKNLLFYPRQVVERGSPWDWALLPLVLAVLVLVAFGAQQMTRPYEIGEPLQLSLEPIALPYYLLRTTLRMFIALGCSLVFSCVFAVLAAKVRPAERVLVPMLDILQSVPILGFLSITVAGFIALFPGNLLGVECAAIFAIFTSQVWNMMMSMSGGWFFVVASEAISVSNQNIMLPGIGSYIARASEARDLGAIGWAIGAMLVGILLYDQLLFRPLVAWADKFRFEETDSGAAPSSWVLSWLRRSAGARAVGDLFASGLERSFVMVRRQHDGTSIRARRFAGAATLTRVWDAAVAAIVLFAVWRLITFIHAEVGWSEVGHVFVLGLYTLVRVLVLIALAALVWVPVGIWIGMNP